MFKSILIINYEKEVLKKIQTAEHASQVTPHGSVKEP